MSTPRRRKVVDVSNIDSILDRLLPQTVDCSAVPTIEKESSISIEIDPELDAKLLESLPFEYVYNFSEWSCAAGRVRAGTIQRYNDAIFDATFEIANLLKVTDTSESNLFFPTLEHPVIVVYRESREYDPLEYFGPSGPDEAMQFNLESVNAMRMQAKYYFMRGNVRISIDRSLDELKADSTWLNLEIEHDDGASEQGHDPNASEQKLLEAFQWLTATVALPLQSFGTLPFQTFVRKPFKHTSPAETDEIVSKILETNGTVKLKWDGQLLTTFVEADGTIVVPETRDDRWTKLAGRFSRQLPSVLFVQFEVLANDVFVLTEVLCVGKHKVSIQDSIRLVRWLAPHCPAHIVPSLEVAPERLLGPLEPETDGFIVLWENSYYKIKKTTTIDLLVTSDGNICSIDYNFGQASRPDSWCIVAGYRVAPFSAEIVGVCEFHLLEDIWTFSHTRQDKDRADSLDKIRRMVGIKLPDELN